VPILVVAAVAAGVRLAWAVVVHSEPTSDFLFYYQSAANLAAGRGYRILGHPTAFFPVGYPAFLAVLFWTLGQSLAVVKASGAALWTASAVLAYGLGVLLGGRRVGLGAGLIVALYPDFIFYSSLAASENLFVPLLMATCLLLAMTPVARLSFRRAAAVGVTLGLAILVRSTALLVPLLFAAIIWARSGSRRGLQLAVVVVAACALMVGPWVTRNMLVMGAPTVSTNGGYTLWIGLNRAATGGVAVRGVAYPWPIRTVHEEVAVNSTDARRALDFIVHDPGRFVGLIPAKLVALLRWQPIAITANTWTTDGRIARYASGRVLPFHEPRHLTSTESALFGFLRHLTGALAGLHYAFLALGVAGFAVGLRRRRPAAGWIAAVVVFWVVFHATLIHGQPRFLLSVTPLLAPAIALLLVAAGGRLAAAYKRQSGDSRQPPRQTARPAVRVGKNIPS
jgi:4-amino-4-deoxy-L-arabinose transferase-like glycosyltransferase